MAMCHPMVFDPQQAAPVHPDLLALHWVAIHLSCGLKTSSTRQWQ
jgi:hypothetical protein